MEDEVTLVAAHPDDEILGLGSRLGRLRRLKIVHLTDGAPRDSADTRRAGCTGWRAYAAMRERELRHALRAVGAIRAECLCYGCPDRQAIRHFDGIVERLASDLGSARTVVTHPYEHGHPDHDTAALAVALACARLRAHGRHVPERYEFASYHLRQGKAVYGVFWPDRRAAEVILYLSAAEIVEKRAALACFVSQREVIANFPVEERVRRAPRYDFRLPAPPRAALYDLYGWAMTSTLWREQAARAVAQLPPEPPACG